MVLAETEVTCDSSEDVRVHPSKTDLTEIGERVEVVEEVGTEARHLIQTARPRVTCN